MFHLYHSFFVENIKTILFSNSTKACKFYSISYHKYFIAVYQKDVSWIQALSLYWTSNNFCSVHFAFSILLKQNDQKIFF